MNTNSTNDQKKRAPHQTTNQSPNNDNECLFSLSQRKYDGKWNLWMNLTPIELGIVTKEQFVAAGQPFWMTQPVETVVEVYKSKPTTSEVMRYIQSRIKRAQRY